MMTSNPDSMPQESIQFVCIVVPDGYAFYQVMEDKTLKSIASDIEKTFGTRLQGPVYLSYHDLSPFHVLHLYTAKQQITHYDVQMINPMNIVL